MNEFRFGNSGTLTSKEVALLPARVGSRTLLVKAAILDGPGRVTPLLLSKEFLRQLGAVLDLERDRCEFRASGERVDLVETKRGHYGVPMFQGIQHGKKLHSEECFAVAKEGHNRAYNITQLEGLEETSPQGHKLPPAREPAVPDHGEDRPIADVQGGGRDVGPAREHRQHDPRGTHGDGPQVAGPNGRPGDGRVEQSHRRGHHHAARQIHWQEPATGLHFGQVVRQLGTGPCESPLVSEHHAVEGVHQRSGTWRNHAGSFRRSPS